MSRKFFGKYLPSYETIRQNRAVALFGPLLRRPGLWHLHRRSAAGGVAVGLFCGLIPGPLQMLAAAAFAVLLRVNLPVAVVMTCYTNPLTIVPLYMAAYKIGQLVTGEGSGPLPRPDFGDGGMSGWLPGLWDWMEELGPALLVGLPVLASALAALGYFTVLGLWRLHATRRWRRRRGGSR